jgi:kynureninase
LIGAPPDTIILHQNVSTLVSIALSALYQPGDRARVITTDLNFPTIIYNLQTHQPLGLEVHMLRSPDGMTIPLEAWEAAIDDRTLAVFIDHGIFRSGFIQDVAAITAMAHRRGAHAIVDAYQTTGCVPYTVAGWGADIVVAGSHKWLCGGAGAAWMYVRPDLLPRLEPRITGWFSHAHPFAFSLTMEYAPNAMRFATGTPGIAALFAARPGTEIVREVGVEAIRRKSLRLTQKIIDLADAHGIRLNTPREPHSRGGLVVLDFPEAEEVSHRLVEARVLVDYRPRAGIRVSPHFYSTDEEVERFFAVIEQVRRPAR